MSAADGEKKEAADTVMCCASCGKAEVDDVKLKIALCSVAEEFLHIECRLICNSFLFDLHEFHLQKL